MRQIPLTQGQVALVDDEDWELVSRHKWYAKKDDRDVYYAETRINGKMVLMHRLILGVTDPGQQIDHRDVCGTNNVRSNLRLCVVGENLRNRRKFISKEINYSSPYKGVSWEQNYNAWRATISKDGYTYRLGSYTTQEEAAAVYNAAAIEMHGDFARLNDVPDVIVKRVNGKGGLPKSNTSGFRGVSWSKSMRKWKSSISHNRKFIIIGHFTDKEDAARAYNQKAIELLGDKARQNSM